jgi:hypothetical protein
VIGKDLPDELQIRYTLFPEGEFSPRFLSEVSSIILSPGEYRESIAHNKRAVQARYGREALMEKFEHLLTQTQ